MSIVLADLLPHYCDVKLARKQTNIYCSFCLLQMISVERVLEYSQLPSEAALESQQGAHPPDDWPRTGSIQADGLCLRYSHNAPIVLKNLSFSIKDKEKVGGREFLWNGYFSVFK